MVMNKQKGMMYSWVSHTWNAIKGKCEHDCSYCYMKRFPQNTLRLDEKCFKDDLGEGNVIFVGSSTDMFAEGVPLNWIHQVLSHCKKYPNNTYLFQSKNPYRFVELMKWKGIFPEKVVFGTTIESNRDHDVGVAPSCLDRSLSLSKLNEDTMVSIEPLLDFDLPDMIRYIQRIEPRFVSIGADSKGHKLPEPDTKKIKELIEKLEKFTEVKIKPNLKRLVGE